MHRPITLKSRDFALGIKGSMNYCSILTGTVNGKAPLKGIESRHPVTSTKPLWPFFVTPSSLNEESGATRSGKKPDQESPEERDEVK